MNTRPALAIAAGIILAVFFTAGLLAPVLAPVSYTHLRTCAERLKRPETQALN